MFVTVSVVPSTSVPPPPPPESLLLDELPPQPAATTAANTTTTSSAPRRRQSFPFTWSSQLERIGTCRTGNDATGGLRRAWRPRGAARPPREPPRRRGGTRPRPGRPAAGVGRPAPTIRSRPAARPR